MFITINEGIIALKSKTLTELKPETEISLEGTFSQGNSVVLDVALDAWLIKETRAPKVLILQGTAGSGKTQFCQKLTIRLWEKYSVDDNPIPLYIALANLKNPTTRAIEETLENIGFNQEQITILKEKHHFIFILDGYDELYEFINLHLSNRLGEWRAQTVITCRSEALYFISDYEKYFVPFKANRRLAIGLQQIEIKPLSALQIEEFLSSHLKDNLNGITYAEVTTIPGLLSLIQTPLLLKAILPIQKYSLVSPKDFYDALIETRFLWQEQKLKLNKLIDRTADFKPYFWSYCKNLALTMQEHETRVITYRQTRASLFENSTEENIWWKFFKVNNKIQWMYFACPLIRNSNSQVEFIDNCLIDYFATQIRFHEELELFSHSSLASMQVQKEPQKIEDLQLPLIGRKLFTNQEEKLQLLADMIVENDAFKASLFNYIESSKTDERYAIAAANAITGLNFANVTFSMMDLRNIRIPSANLTGAILDYANLEGADLREATLREAWLKNTTFKNSNMCNVIFGELACKQVDCVKNSCIYSSDGNFFAIARHKITDSVINVLRDISRHEVYIYRVGKSGELIFDRAIADDGYINSVAFSACNQWLATGNHDATISLWRLTGSIIKQTLTGHTGSVNSLAFSPQQLASGSDDNTIRLWSLTNFSNKALIGHTDKVSSVAFSPDNQWLASGSADTTVRLWNLNDLNDIKVLTGHHREVYSVTFSPDSQWLASGSADTTVRLWNLNDLNNIKVLTGHHREIYSVTFSPNSQWLASGSADTTVRLWNLNDLNNIKVLTGHTKLVLSVIFSPDSQWLISGSSDKSVRFWNAQVYIGLYNKTSTNKHSDSVFKVTFSPNGQWLASGSADTTVRLWNLLNPYNNKILTNWHNDFVRRIIFSPNSKWLVSISDDNMVCLCNLMNSVNNKILTNPIDSVFSVIFSSNSQWLTLGSYDKTIIYLWNLIDFPKMHILTGHKCSIRSVAFSPNNQWLASGSNDNTINLWNLSDLSNPHILTGHTGSVNIIIFSLNNQWLASESDDNTIRLWSLMDYTVKQTLNRDDNNSGILNITISPKSQKFISRSCDNTICFWSTEASANFVNNKTTHNSSVVTLSPDGQWKALGENNIIHFSLFDNLCKPCCYIFKFSFHVDFKIYSMDYHKIAAHLYLATGGSDGSVRIWKHHCNENKLFLFWTTCQRLYATEANITSAMLSLNNKELLQQLGAIGEPVNYETNATALLNQRTKTRESEMLINFQNAANEGNTQAQRNLGAMYYNGKGVSQDYVKAIEWFQKAASQGNTEAKLFLGLMYKDGQGVTQDYTVAFEYFQEAANQGNANAQNELGFMYYSGEGVPQDYIKALEWHQKAANQGNTQAQRNLGAMYYNGKGVFQDYVKAIEWFQKAASQGNTEAKLFLGLMYKDGQGVTQDYTIAFEYFQEAANQGNANAQDRLGFMYYSGEGIPQDYVKAIEWFQKAASQGNTEAKLFLGLMYKDGQGVTQDYTIAFEYFQEAANQGNVNAQNKLGFMYYSGGGGVPQDYIKALEWYQKAVNQGDKTAQKLSAKIQKDLGVQCVVSQDYVKAIEWFQKAANQGNAKAQLLLGLMYKDGQGTAQDHIRAFECFQKAANQGKADAKLFLGLMYKNGQGVTQDYTIAFEYFQEAANQGNTNAQNELGFMYYSGEGVPQDYIKALEWHQKAANQGDVEAQHKEEDEFKAEKNEIQLSTQTELLLFSDTQSQLTPVLPDLVENQSVGVNFNKPSL